MIQSSAMKSISNSLVREKIRNGTSAKLISRLSVLGKFSKTMPMVPHHKMGLPMYVINEFLIGGFK